MKIKAEYMGKKVNIVDAYGNKYAGKVVEMEGPEETESGEPEIGINFAGGITMFAESEIETIEEITKK